METATDAPITSKRNIKLASLFCGAGGLDIGFERAGFKTVWANDILPEACETHRSWSDAEVVCANIKDINIASIPDVQIITGGFPCQGFSLAGPRKLDDKRNSLYKFFVDVLEKKQPDVFVAENVKGILTLGNGKIIDAILQDFSDKGYEVKIKLVNAADYEVPQDRFRVLMVGTRKEITFEFPKPKKNKISIKDALKEIEAPRPEDICDAPYSSRYMSRNRKRNWDSVSYTIPAMAKQCPLHPSSPNMIKISQDKWCFGNGITRRLSWQEAAAIQTFPKNLNISGSLQKKYLQIGNAVPVKLAESIGKAIMDQVFQ